MSSITLSVVKKDVKITASWECVSATKFYNSQIVHGM